MKLRSLVAVTLLLVSAARVANAADNRAAAREHYEAGSAHYNLREYPDALREFSDAYRLFREPVFLFNIAQCHRQLGDPASAASFYRAYRREANEIPNREELDRLISDMDRAAQAKAAAQPAHEATPSTIAPVTPAQPSVTTAAVLTASPPPPHRSLAKQPWFWGVVVGGVAVVAVGVTLGVVYGRSSGPTASYGVVQGP